jgi:hypothetical protein
MLNPFLCIDFSGLRIKLNLKKSLTDGARRCSPNDHNSLTSERQVGIWPSDLPTNLASKVVPARQRGRCGLHGNWQEVFASCRDFFIFRSHAEELIWREHEEAHPLVRNFLAQVRHQMKRDGEPCA